MSQNAKLHSTLKQSRNIIIIMLNYILTHLRTSPSITRLTVELNHENTKDCWNLLFNKAGVFCHATISTCKKSQQQSYFFEVKKICNLCKHTCLISTLFIFNVFSKKQIYPLVKLIFHPFKRQKKVHSISVVRSIPKEIPSGSDLGHLVFTIWVICLRPPCIPKCTTTDAIYTDQK